MKARYIYEGTHAIRTIIGEKLPIKGAYAIGRLAKKLEDEFKLLEDVRISLVKKFGTEQEDGNFTIRGDDQESLNSFLAEFNEILDDDIEFTFTPIDMEQLGAVTITPALSIALDPFIKVES